MIRLVWRRHLSRQVHTSTCAVLRFQRLLYCRNRNSRRNARLEAILHGRQPALVRADGKGLFGRQPRERLEALLGAEQRTLAVRQQVL